MHSDAQDDADTRETLVKRISGRRRGKTIRPKHYKAHLLKSGFARFTRFSRADRARAAHLITGFGFRLAVAARPSRAAGP